MTGDGVVARRYARALFEVAREHDSQALVEEQLKLLVETVSAHPEFRRIIRHPNIDAAAKTELVKQVFKGEMDETLLRTVNLLFERGRSAMLAELYHAFVQTANDALGRADAIVASPFPVSAEEVQEIADKFSKLCGKTIRVQTVMDPTLLGGIKVRIGDRLYDGSLSGKLERLKKGLTESKAI
ncbi:MAG TPA: F0F1 ATP synthase subunit delta [Bacilli bacterium]